MTTYNEALVESLFGGPSAIPSTITTTDITTNGPSGVSASYDEGLNDPAFMNDDDDVFASAMGTDVSVGMPSGNLPSSMMVPFGNIPLAGTIGKTSTTLHPTASRQEAISAMAPLVKKEFQMDSTVSVGSPVTEESVIVAKDESGKMENEDDDEAEDNPQDSRSSMSSSRLTSKVTSAGGPQAVTQPIRKRRKSTGNTVATGRRGRNPVPPVKRGTHNSHTKRCRDKVNQRFHELVSVLPPAPDDVEVKHKAQILDYTIHVFKSLNFKKACLEAQLALCSTSSLNEWVMSTVKKSSNLRTALASFFDLMCTRGRWKFAEAWFPVQGREGLLANPTLEFGFGHIPKVTNPEDDSHRGVIESFIQESRSYRFEPRSGVPGRVVCTMRPEWLPRLDNGETFLRARLAIQGKIRICFAVPIIVCGYVAAVAVFFDTSGREYDPTLVDLAHNVASTMGNAFGAYKGMSQSMSAPKLGPPPRM